MLKEYDAIKLHSQHGARNREIIKRWGNGESYGTIMQDYGITRERVRGLVNRFIDVHNGLDLPLEGKREMIRQILTDEYIQRD